MLKSNEVDNARPATKDASWITWDLTLLSRVSKSLVRIAESLERGSCTIMGRLADSSFTACWES
jgi:hypothetical protein